MAISGGPDIVEDGLVLHLDAADRNSYPGTGSTWYDLCGNSNFLLTNGAALNSQYRGSMALDGVNDYVRGTTFSTEDYWEDSDPFTVITFHRITNTLSYASGLFSNQRYFTENNPGGFGLMLYGYTSVRRYYIYMTHDDGAGTKVQYGLSSGNGELLFDGTIVCIAGVYDPSTNSLKLYKNGSLMSSSTNAAYKWSTRNANTGECRIGIGLQGGWTYTHQGNIYNMMVYNTALDADQILDTYNALKGRFGL
jgi:hypothetical protein